MSAVGCQPDGRGIQRLLQQEKIQTEAHPYIDHKVTHVVR